MNDVLAVAQVHARAEWTVEHHKLLLEGHLSKQLLGSHGRWVGRVHPRSRRGSRGRHEKGKAERHRCKWSVKSCMHDFKKVDWMLESFSPGHDKKLQSVELSRVLTKHHSVCLQRLLTQALASCSHERELCQQRVGRFEPVRTHARACRTAAENGQQKRRRCQSWRSCGRQCC
jgi:hypothetical protein